MSRGEAEEIFFRCPRCDSLFSSPRRALEQDRHMKALLTGALLGGKISPAAYMPKCIKCGARLEKISEEEFKKEMERPAPEKPP